MAPRAPSQLDWVDVAPALGTRAAAVGEEASSLARKIIPAARPSGGSERIAVATAIDAGLRSVLGDWVAGWAWSARAGGPVHGWCCPVHSVWQEGESDSAPTVRRVAEAVTSWRDWIRCVAEVFDEQHALRSDRGPRAVLESRAVRLIELVVERTAAHDAWYGLAEQVLSWSLQALGEPVEIADALVAGALAGRFESWVEPGADAARTAARTLRDLWLERHHDAPDALDAWWSHRGSIDWRSAPPVSDIRSPVDAMLAHVVQHDAALDDRRGDRMIAALDHVRISARRGDALDWDRLQEWHRLAVGGSSTLRIRDAWARDAAERYGTPRDLAARVDAALRDAAAPLPTASRAARLYLDLCFLHPFADGNARLARLAMDHVLTAAGVAIDDPERWLLRMPLSGLDPDVGRRYLAILSRHLVRSS
jgi:hypothetical protein